MESAFQLLGHVFFPDFDSPSSASFTVCVPSHKRLFNECKHIIYNELGWIDVHRDCSDEFEIRIRLSLPTELQNDDAIETIRLGLFNFLDITNHSSWMIRSWMIRVYSSKSVRCIEHRDPTGLRGTSI